MTHAPPVAATAPIHSLRDALRYLVVAGVAAGMACYRAPRLLPLGWDEEQYQLAARHFPAHVPGMDFSPAFIAVYAVVARSIADADAAYFVFRSLLAIGVSVATCSLASACVGEVAAVCCGCFVAALDLTTAAWTIAFAGPILSAVVSRLGALRHPAGAATLASAGAFLRPEFALPGLLFALLAWRDVRRSKAFWAVGIAAVAWFELGPREFGQGRLLFAFQQHFALTEGDWGWRGDPWHGWQSVFAANFGEARSVLDCVRAAPSVFARHVLHNVALLPVEFRKIFVFSYATVASRLLPPILVFSGLVVAFVRRADLPASIRPVALSGLCYASLLPLWLVIRPKSQYLWTVAPVLVVVAAAGLEALWRKHAGGRR